jgi:hypothetical protein
MSDLWIVPPDDLGLIHAEEGSVTFKLIGIGISEVDYDCEIYSTASTAILKADGDSIAKGYSGGMVYSIAEVVYPLQINSKSDSAEIPFEINSTHTYYTDSYDPSIKPSTSESGYTNNLSSMIFWITPRFTGYQFAGMGWGGCSGNQPFGYRNYCPITDACQLARKCAPAVSQGIQGYGIKVRTWWFTTCYISYFYTPARPYCR